MTKLVPKVTVDDLIVEYMVQKVKNGYEPNFLTSEFIDFLKYYETKKDVEDVLYDGEKLFKRFFERKNKCYYNNYKDSEFNYENKHMDMIYNCRENEFLIAAKNCLSPFDTSVINTYFISEEERKEIRSIINDYLEKFPKRIIDENTIINKEKYKISKYFAAQIVDEIWTNIILKEIEYQCWPKQCKDINKYLFDIDLASVINVVIDKELLFEIYKVMAKRIGILYSKDDNLEIKQGGSFLAYANYKLLIKDYEKIMNDVYGPFKKYTMNIDINKELNNEKNSLFNDQKTKTLIKNLDNIK